MSLNRLQNCSQMELLDTCQSELSSSIFLTLSLATSSHLVTKVKCWINVLPYVLNCSKRLGYECAVLASLHHFTLQGGNYVLPLRLWGAPLTMSCPAVSSPPSVSCFPSGMVVKIGGITANELKVKGR